MKVKINESLLEKLSIADLYAIRLTQETIIKYNEEGSIFRKPAEEILFICIREIDRRISEIFII